MKGGMESYKKPKVIGKHEIMLAYPVIAFGAFLAGIIFGFATYVIENTAEPPINNLVLKGSL